MYSQIKQQLRDANVILESGQLNKQSSKILTKYPELVAEILTLTNFLYADAPLNIRLLCVKNNITESPHCIQCGKELKPLRYIYTKQRFARMCQNTKGHSCAIHNVELNAQRIQKNLEKYGTENVLSSSSIREQIKKTCQEKYNGNAPGCDTTIKEKMRATYLKNNDLSIVSSKRKQTNQQKYGAPTFAQGQLPQSTLDKVLELSYDRDWLVNQHHNLKLTITDIARDIGITTSTLCSRFKQLNIPIILHNSHNNISSEELALLSYIRSLMPEDIEILTNDRTTIGPQELDIFIPRYNIAFEYCGIFWHSELSGRGRAYHLAKHKKCLAKNIRLVQIWDSEWKHKERITKGRIRHILQQHQQVIYARKCSITEINNRIANDFFEANHIQGKCNSTLNYALMYESYTFPVGIMSFGKSRFHKDGTMELLRYSPAIDFNVVGGAGKLFQHFLRNNNVNKLVTYCDLRWNIGTLYPQLGFKFSHTSTPNYHYFNRNGDTTILLSRQNFQKHKLKNKLPTFDNQLSEWENMINNNYDRIWDCGNDVYYWTNPTRESTTQTVNSHQ